jgi:hypothetical protein
MGSSISLAYIGFPCMESNKTINIPFDKEMRISSITQTLGGVCCWFTKNQGSTYTDTFTF